MKRIAFILLLLPWVSGCESVEWAYEHVLFGPPSWRPYQALDETENSLSSVSDTSNALSENFKRSKLLARLDSEMISSGEAPPSPGTLVAFPVKGDLSNALKNGAGNVEWDSIHWTGTRDGTDPVAYSPLALIPSANCDNSSGGGDQSRPNPTASKAETNPDQQQSQTKSGCSYKSQHARQMAYDGFKLADSYCADFFRRKGVVQDGTSLVSDFASGATSLAGSVAGLVTGSAAAPSAIGGLVGLTSEGAALTNKNFLFGQENIGDTYKLVASAEAADTATALNPQDTEWDYVLAVGAIRRHQAICTAPNILALIKLSVNSTAVTVNNANGDSTTACPDGTLVTNPPSSEAATPPSDRSKSQPTTMTATISTTSNTACNKKSGETPTNVNHAGKKG